MSKNIMEFENGIIHEFSDDEMKLLKIAIKDFNWANILCSEKREAELREAFNRLESVFLHHLD